MASNKDTSSLDAGKGSVGHEFTEKGSVGGTAQQVGGPFDKEGAIGKQFKPEGSVGGTAQSAAEQMQGDKPGLFDKDGAIGKQFRRKIDLFSLSWCLSHGIVEHVDLY